MEGEGHGDVSSLLGHIFLILLMGLAYRKPELEHGVNCPHGFSVWNIHFLWSFYFFCYPCPFTLAPESGAYGILYFYSSSMKTAGRIFQVLTQNPGRHEVCIPNEGSQRSV